IPELPTAAVGALQAAERAAAAARLSDCLRISAGAPELAALLASIGASEAAHAVAIGTAEP
ncbi:MAG: hypothetical protein M3P91_10305, partial [Actinomycetota bacterium]|nr:hypothetical protein [Actinomycetota bacterium]